MGRCVLCGGYVSGDEKNHFLERGLSRTERLCEQCSEQKKLIRNYDVDEIKRNSAIEKIKEHMKNKTPIVCEIVNGWIDGTEINYYGNEKNVLYRVVGPEATLFVFNTHFTILSDRVISYREDYTMFYDPVPYGSILTGKPGEKCVIMFQCSLSDKEKINGTLDVEHLRYCVKRWFASSTLNFSMGEYGTLNFGDVSFKFYYYQNQLMEEVYNYIQKRMEHPDVEEEEIAQSVSDIPSVLSKQIEKKIEEDKVSFSLADEIVKLKGLLDSGMLSQEEFDKAKNKLIDKL